MKIKWQGKTHYVSKEDYKRIERKAKSEGKTLGETYALENGLVIVEPQKKVYEPKKEAIPQIFLNLNEEDFEELCPVEQRVFDPVLEVYFCGHHMKAKVTTSSIRRNMVNPGRCKLCMQIRREQKAEEEARKMEKAKERENSYWNRPPKVDWGDSEHVSMFDIRY